MALSEKDLAENDPEFDLEFELLGDLDGDSFDEDLITFITKCRAHNCTWAIFITNKGCPQYVGLLEGTNWTLGPDSHNGLLDIHSRLILDCAGEKRYEITLEFNGQVFQEEERILVDNCPE